MGCAVRALVLNVSPLAVRLPWKPGPYQEAAPVWIGWVSSAIAELAPSAHPRTTAVMAEALESLVMLSGFFNAPHNIKCCSAEKEGFHELTS